MGTSCPTLLADLFLDSYEAGIFSEKPPQKKPALTYNFTFRYIDDVLYLITPCLVTSQIVCIPLNLINGYHMSATYIDLHTELDSKARLRSTFYDKKDYFNVYIVTFLFMQ